MSGMDSLTEFYVQENMQLLGQLEETLLAGQSADGGLEKKEIEEIFRTMHTIKGASAMMGYDSLTKLTHSIEDVFDEIRNGLELSHDKWEELIDLVLDIIDFLKEEISNVNEGLLPESSIDDLHEKAVGFLKHAKNDGNDESVSEEAISIELPGEDTTVSEQPTQSSEERHLRVNVFFENGCAMESIRALGVTTMVEGMCTIEKTIPEDLSSDCDDEIAKDGFSMFIKAGQDISGIEKTIQETMFLKNYEIVDIVGNISKENVNSGPDVNNEENAINESVISVESDIIVQEDLKIIDKPAEKQEEIPKEKELHKEEEVNKQEEVHKQEHESAKPVKKEQHNNSHAQTKNSYLTVNINKIDILMNLVGEIVTTESMVEKQSKLENFDLDNFEKQARRLHQLTNELQDVVMSIRMVPISSTFTKMQRVVRDMSKKTGKEVDLVLIGEQTEVDKNILENISDPLMHMIRNSMDHGIETPEERRKTPKPEKATITLEAKNTGGDVVIIIKDDGRGLNKEAIVKKATEKGITTKNIEDISDKEAYNFILSPGFSTKEAVTEYSGRGVGMDVVYTNIRKLRGSISIDSEPGKGTMFIMRIPLTLAIVDGMKLKIGDEIYIIPSLNIKEVFRQGAYEIVQNPNGEEHSIIRGQCYEICRLSNILGLEEKNTEEGIMVLVESEMGNVCIIVDSIIGQQQVVIKPIPTLLTKFEKVQAYMSGCSILEDGSIGLIFDVNAVINR